MTKTCKVCCLEKSLGEFQPKKRYKLGVSSVCRKCLNKQAQAWRLSNPEKVKTHNSRRYWKNPDKAKNKSRFHRFKTKYWPDLTIKQCESEWNRLFKDQQGLCSICKRKKFLEVGHCHKTNKVRSLACNGCNTALARIEENPKIAAALIEYIEKHAY